MKREHLEHLLRAAGAIAQEEELVVIGSQAILGSFAAPPPLLIVSMEADIYPLRAPHKSDLIDGSIGERSPFHETFGYYAHGVGPETASVPYRWLSRAVSLCNSNTGGVTGICLHPVDLAISKLLAGRKKDHAFVTVMLAERIITAADIRAVLDELPDEQRRLLETRL